MPSKAEIRVTGHVANADKLQFGSSGNAFIRFTIASNFKKKSEQHALFFRCVAFGKQAEWIAEHDMEKGDLVQTFGELTTEEYQGKTQLNVNVSNFFWFRKKNEKREQQPSAKPEAFDYGPAPADDLPF
jgi:single-stranded DNA-binding protein